MLAIVIIYVTTATVIILCKRVGNQMSKKWTEILKFNIEIWGEG